MIALNRSLLNREYNLINVLKALASIISMYCSTLLNTSLQQLCTDHVENTASIVKEVRLLVRYILLDVFLLRAYASRECVYRVVT
jgi:propanediol dehydratase large subunit